MAQDRYLKGVLTVIALALVYLSVVLTPWPGVGAQAQTTPPIVRPGEITGPMQVVVVGWRGKPGEFLPVAVTNPVAATVQNTVQVAGRVTTERSTGTADRVVLAGWEQRGDPARAGNFRPFDPTTPQPGLPTTTVPR